MSEDVSSRSPDTDVGKVEAEDADRLPDADIFDEMEDADDDDDDDDLATILPPNLPFSTQLSKTSVIKVILSWKELASRISWNRSLVLPLLDSAEKKVLEQSDITALESKPLGCIFPLAFRYRAADGER